MATAGLLAGALLDRIIARLAREPYERALEGDAQAAFRAEAAHLALAPPPPEPIEMPSLLTTRGRYRTAAVVVATAALFGMAGARYGANPAHTLIVAGYIAVLIICTGTDLLAYRVANVVTYPAIGIALVIGMLLPDANWRGVIAGGLIFGGVLLVPSVLTNGAMGMGDVKLAFFVGFALGLTLVVPAMLMMALSGGVVAVVLLTTRLRGKGDPIPYAPFIAGGALVVLLVQGVAFHSLR